MSVTKKIIKIKIKLCTFIVVPGGSLALLEMADIEILGILCVKCGTTEFKRHLREINEQSIEGKSCTDKTLMLLQQENNKSKYIW